MLIRFAIYGLLGWCVEILYTALVDFRSTRDWRLVGTTYLWMFPIYGSMAFFYETLHNAIRDQHWLLRAAIWSVGITLVELVSGWGIRRATGSCPWDYSKHRLAINAYIRWDYFPLWAAFGLLMEPVHDFLVRLTPEIRILLTL